MKNKLSQSYLVLNFSTIVGLTVINICLIRNLFLKSTMSWNIHQPVYSYYGNIRTPYILIVSILLALQQVMVFLQKNYFSMRDFHHA